MNCERALVMRADAAVFATVVFATVIDQRLTIARAQFLDRPRAARNCGGKIVIMPSIYWTDYNKQENGLIIDMTIGMTEGPFVLC